MTHPRGTVALRIDDKIHGLRLTLGALAELEEAFGGDLRSLGDRLKNPSVGDILTILHALLRGGGASLTMEALRASDIDFSEAAKAIGSAFDALDGMPGKSPAVKEAAK